MYCDQQSRMHGRCFVHANYCGVNNSSKLSHQQSRLAVPIWRCMPHTSIEPLEFSSPEKHICHDLHLCNCCGMLLQEQQLQQRQNALAYMCSTLATSSLLLPCLKPLVSPTTTLLQASALHLPSCAGVVPPFLQLATSKPNCASCKPAATLARLQVLLISLAVVAWWGKALLHIPPHLTWPFNRLLAFPHASNYLEVGAVTVLPWVAMCDRVSSLLARVAFPQQLLDLRTKPLSTVLEEPEPLLS